MNALQNWKTLSRETVFSRRPWLEVEQHQVALPDGKIIPDWTWVVTPEFVNVVAVTMDGSWLCFRQVKYAVQGETLALVGGLLEPGESPEAAAKRELMEETGYEATAWESLGSYAVDANRGAGVAHLFLARGARRSSQPQGGDLEEQRLMILSQDQVEEALKQHAFKVLSWTTAVTLALLRMARPSP